MYSNDSTIRELVDKLMIDQWNVSPIFENYYNECQPTHCTYTFSNRHDVIYIITTLFGLAGGLITVLKLFIPRVIKLLRKKKEQQQVATGKLRVGTSQ
jgi:hypothetical protein